MVYYFEIHYNVLGPMGEPPEGRFHPESTLRGIPISNPADIA
jgi:hypothetical protein